MKTKKIKIGIYAACIISLLMASCATNYKSPNLATAKQNHKTIAIVPFDITIEPNKIPKKVTAEYIKQTEEIRKENTDKLRYATQKAFYACILRKEHKLKYPIKVQNIEETNQLLLKAGISPEKIKNYTKSEIAAICNVDGVIVGSINLPSQGFNKWRQTLGLIIGCSSLGLVMANMDPIAGGNKVLEVIGWSGYGFGTAISINYGRAATYDVNLFDGKTNELLWKYNYLLPGLGAYSVNSGVGIERVFKKFPYNKRD